MLNISKLIVIFSTIFSILISQEHFIPIYSGNPYLAMNLYATSATIDTVNMTVNDEIGIFDGENCVGVGVVLDEIYELLFLKAATDDPGTTDIDGFTPGNLITYRLWDASSEMEITDVIAMYSLGEGIFASQGDVAFDLAGVTEECSINDDCTVNASCVGNNCVCNAGYEGNGLSDCADIDNCVNQPCSGNGTCEDGVDSYTCICDAGYAGTNCETDIDECNGIDCGNGGTCTEDDGETNADEYTCTCATGYEGGGINTTTCTDIDECLTDNGGCGDAICVNNDGADPACSELSLFNGLIPEEFSIHSIYPNPFNPVTNILYGIPGYVNVQIIIYDLSGRLVEILIDQLQTPGYHSVNWNADNHPSGLYFARIIVGEFTNTQKLILMK